MGRCEQLAGKLETESPLKGGKKVTQRTGTRVRGRGKESTMERGRGLSKSKKAEDSYR